MTYYANRLYEHSYHIIYYSFSVLKPSIVIKQKKKKNNKKYYSLIGYVFKIRKREQ